MHENGVRKQVELTHTKAGEGGGRVQRLSPRALQILEKAQARAGVDIDTIRYNSGHLHLETTLGYIRRAKDEAENSEKWDEIFD